MNSDLPGMQREGRRPLVLMRHAQPLIAAGVCYGATDMDADTSATQRAAQELAPLLAPGIQLWSSPLRRCMQLSQALRTCRTDLTIRQDPRLAEMDFGDWEGWRWADIPRAALDAWTAQFWQLRFGGRESVADLMARVGAAWHEAGASRRPVAWVTHAGVIRAARLWSDGVTELQDATRWPAEAPGFGGHVVL
jgi:alpha-ribazole phosphatase